MVLSDRQIREQLADCINPFIPETIKQVNGKPIVSYGLTSTGYDIRLAKGCMALGYGEINPKHHNPTNFRTVPLCEDESGLFYAVPAMTTVLCSTVEQFNIPRNITGICIGKSTYARCGIIVNTTAIAPEWAGYLTLELLNGSSGNVRLYVNEGIAHIQFTSVSDVEVSYKDADGQYINQTQQPRPSGQYFVKSLDKV